jgi:type IV pilus assembly protein PilV
MSLIEVLIGILIFTFGVLGLVGLQASMTRAQTSGKVRADASALAAEVIGAMWADASNLAKYNGAGCAGYAPCADWQAKVAQAMPAGEGDIQVAGTSVRVKITWTIPGEGQHQYETQTAVSQ